MNRSLSRLIFIGSIWVYSLVYCIEVSRLNNISDKVVILSVFSLMTAITGFEMFRLFFQYRRGTSDYSDKTTIRSFLTSKKVLLVAASILYLILLPVLGYFTASFSAYCLFNYILDNRGVVKVCLSGLALLCAIYIIFPLLLNLTLPQGLLF